MYIDLMVSVGLADSSSTCHKINKLNFILVALHVLKDTTDKATTTSLLLMTFNINQVVP